MNTKLAGIVGKPETRYTPDGKAVLTFSLGQYTGGNKTDGYKDRAWVKVEAWGDVAESSAWVEKGKTVTVEGQPKTPRKWTGKDGVERDEPYTVVAAMINEGDDFWTIGKGNAMESEKVEEVW